jgi:hypothetical protein
VHRRARLHIADGQEAEGPAHDGARAVACTKRQRDADVRHRIAALLAAQRTEYRLAHSVEALHHEPLGLLLGLLLRLLLLLLRRHRGRARQHDAHTRRVRLGERGACARAEGEYMLAQRGVGTRGAVGQLRRQAHVRAAAHVLLARLSHQFGPGGVRAPPPQRDLVRVRGRGRGRIGVGVGARAGPGAKAGAGPGAKARAGPGAKAGAGARG